MEEKRVKIYFYKQNQLGKIGHSLWQQVHQINEGIKYSASLTKHQYLNNASCHADKNQKIKI